MNETTGTVGETTEPKKKDRKPRETGKVIIEQMTTCDGPESVANLWSELQIPDIETTADALRWIREKGEDGNTYRVARVKEPMTVSVEKVEVRNVRG